MQAWPPVLAGMQAAKQKACRRSECLQTESAPRDKALCATGYPELGSPSPCAVHGGAGVLSGRRCAWRWSSASCRWAAPQRPGMHFVNVLGAQTAAVGARGPAVPEGRGPALQSAAEIHCLMLLPRLLAVDWKPTPHAALVFRRSLHTAGGARAQVHACSLARSWPVAHSSRAVLSRDCPGCCHLAMAVGYSRLL